MVLFTLAFSGCVGYATYGYPDYPYYSDYGYYPYGTFSFHHDFDDFHHFRHDGHRHFGGHHFSGHFDGGHRGGGYGGRGRSWSPNEGRGFLPLLFLGNRKNALSADQGVRRRNGYFLKDLKRQIGLEQVVWNFVQKRRRPWKEIVKSPPRFSCKQNKLFQNLRPPSHFDSLCVRAYIWIIKEGIRWTLS